MEKVGDWLSFARLGFLKYLQHDFGCTVRRLLEIYDVQLVSWSTQPSGAMRGSLTSDVGYRERDDRWPGSWQRSPSDQFLVIRKCDDAIFFLVGSLALWHRRHCWQIRLSSREYISGSTLPQVWWGKTLLLYEALQLRGHLEGSQGWRLGSQGL